MAYHQLTSFTVTRYVCLRGALARSCTISVAKSLVSPLPRSTAALRTIMAPNKCIMEDKDNPAPVFSGETKDWCAFKDAIQLRADNHDTTWLFENGRSLAEFFARQIKEKTNTDKKTRKKALEREKASSDNNHVSTSVDAYTNDALKEWFEDKDIVTVLQLSLNKNHGSNFTDYKKLGFKDEATLANC